MKLKIEALQTADEYIEKLKPAINELIGYYRQGDIGHGSETMLDIIDGLRWVIDVIGHTQDVLIGEVNLKDIKGILQDIIDAMANQDDVLIADLFEYEILDILDNSQNIITQTLGEYPDYLN